MLDKSNLDTKYFIDADVYNCPFCNRRNVIYKLILAFPFHWTEKNLCYVYVVQCSSCDKRSMHLSHEEIHSRVSANVIDFSEKNIDSKIFYSVPTSFFVMDNRIPKIIRQLIDEADGCLKINYLTGASACMRKAIYELLIDKKAQGNDYENRIKFLKSKYQQIDPSLFDVLAQIQNMTSDKIHEQSWDKWDSPYLRLIITTLKIILEEIYVLPEIKADRYKEVQKMRENLTKDKKSKRGPANSNVPLPDKVDEG